jgi:hypothetical protein
MVNVRDIFAHFRPIEITFHSILMAVGFWRWRLSAQPPILLEAETPIRFCALWYLPANAAIDNDIDIGIGSGS